MDFNTFKDEVQVEFPIKFEDTFIEEDDNLMIDKILTSAIRKVKAKYEKIETTTLIGSQQLPRATSIMQVTPADSTDNQISIFNRMPGRDGYKVKHYFDTFTKQLVVVPEGASVYVRYSVDSSLLTIEDFDDIRINTAIRLADAMLKVKEGYLGTNINLTDMPFDLNYEEMLEEGKENQTTILDELNEQYSGILAIRTN